MFRFRNDLEWLNHFVEKGYLLHGSPQRLPCLTPQQAHDTQRESGCHNGIYATRCRSVAIVSSLLLPRGKGYWRSIWEGDDKQLRVIGFNLAFATQGYVYILAPAPFQELKEKGVLTGEYLAKQEVEPAGVIPFTPEIVHHLPIDFKFY